MKKSLFVLFLIVSCFLTNTKVYGEEVSICGYKISCDDGNLILKHADNAGKKEDTSLKTNKKKAEEKDIKAVRSEPALTAEIIADKNNHLVGNSKGSFVIIEFFDYNCGYCKMMNKKLAEAVKKSDNIRWILMDAPIFGEKSEIISNYAFAAAKQGKFAEYHIALGEEDDKSEKNLKEIGKKLGLDVAKLEKDAHSDAAKENLQRIRKYTQKLNLSGVPMFIINGKVQMGAFSDDQLEEYIKEAEEMKK